MIAAACICHKTARPNLDTIVNNSHVRNALLEIIVSARLGVAIRARARRHFAWAIRSATRDKNRHNGPLCVCPFARRFDDGVSRDVCVGAYISSL